MRTPSGGSEAFAPRSREAHRAFAAATLLNAAFVAVEAGYGVVNNSLALLADAGHNLSDLLGLLLAWAASLLAARSSSPQRTYGFRRATIIAPLVSAILLLIALGGIGWEAVRRISQPRPAASGIIMAVAGVGVLVNALTALLFFPGQKRDLNIRAAFLHMAADAGVSLGVVAAGGGMLLTGWFWLDPLVSLGIILVILLGTWRLLRASFNLSLDAVPPGVDMPAIRAYLEGLPGVIKIHDLHVWPLSTTETALTVHLVMAATPENPASAREIQSALQSGFGIGHATIQIEGEPEQACLLDSPKCVPPQE